MLGQGGFEGIQNDTLGNVYIVEDIGGPAGTVNTHAKQPNSFIYRFCPTTRATWTGRQAAGARRSRRSSTPARSCSTPARPTPTSSRGHKDLHTYGQTFETLWVTIHDTASDGTAAFDANAAAKEAGGTPFKRPENGVFKPGTGFNEVLLHGDRRHERRRPRPARPTAASAAFRSCQQDPKSDKGTLPLFYQSDRPLGLRQHHVLRQVAADRRAGRGRRPAHALNALDSALHVRRRRDYSGGAQPVKVIAEGRDPSATIDSAIGATSGNGFKNEGDNEITGIHESNGDPTADGILGAAIPKGLDHGWRLFFTHQHGDNVTSEVIPA